MRKFSNVHAMFVQALAVVGVVALAPEASANTACAGGRCSTASARMTLEGRDALHTEIDTGWMPKCGNGQEHCNKGLQVRAGIALTAAPQTGTLFKAEMGAGAAVQASWEDEGQLVLRSDSIGTDSTLNVTHSLAPQFELYVDIGVLEKGFVWSKADLLNKLPGASFDYLGSGSGTFPGWGFDGGEVKVPAPSLQSTQIFSLDLSKLKADSIMQGQIALHARTSPTFKYRTTKITVDGKPILGGASTQLPFPPGDFDYLDLPAEIEGELSAEGEIEILPSVTLSQLGDMNFSPAMTITFSSVKETKSLNSPPQKYTFPDKTIHIPLPNVKRPMEGLDGGDVELGSDGTVDALVENTGESNGLVILESSDSRFVVPSHPVSLAPKSKTPLNITFRPDELGSAEAVITAHSNDPDSPEFTFTVRARGVEPGTTGGKKGAKGGDDDDDVFDEVAGCGCRTAGTPDKGYAGLGALALAVGAVVARRRRR